MLTKNIGRILFGIALILFSNSCRNSKCYCSKFEENPRYRFSYKLTIEKNKYKLEKKQLPNFLTTFSGHIVKVDFSKYLLIDDFNVDSMKYPVEFVKDEKIEKGFKITMPKSLLINGMLLLNDTIYFEKEFPKWTKLVDTNLYVEARPERLQIISRKKSDVLFGVYEIQEKSIVYNIPDAVNTITIKTEPLDSLPIGIKNIVFDKKRLTLSADSNIIQFNKCSKWKCTKDG